MMASSRKEKEDLCTALHCKEKKRKEKKRKEKGVVLQASLTLSKIEWQTSHFGNGWQSRFHITFVFTIQGSTARIMPS